MKNSTKFPQKIKNRTTILSSNSTLSISLKKMKTLTWKETFTLMFLAALFIIAKIWKQPKWPLVDEWVKKVNGILFGNVKNELSLFVTTWMKLGSIILSAMSQTDKYHMIFFICGIKKKLQAYRYREKWGFVTEMRVGEWVKKGKRDKNRPSRWFYVQLGCLDYSELPSNPECLK